MQKTLLSLYLANIFLVLLVFICLTAGLRFDRQQLLEQAKGHAENLTDVLTENVGESLVSFNRALEDISRTVVEQHEQNTLSGKELTKALRAHAEKERRVLSFFIMDKNGNLTHASHKPRDMPDLSGRKYFTIHKNNPNIGLYISETFVGELRMLSETPYALIVFSRRIEDKRGNFLGIAATSLTIKTLHQFYRTLDIGNHGHLAISKNNGSLLVQSPPTQQTIFEHQVFPIISKQIKEKPKDTFTLQYPHEKHKRLLSYKTLPDSGLIVFTTLSYQDILQGWYTRALGAFGVVFLICTVITAFTIYVRRKIIHEYEISQAYQNAQSVAKLGHWHWDPVKKRMRWSSQMYEIFELPPTLTNPRREDWEQKIHPDDRDSVRLAARLCIKERIPQNVDYRIICDGGKEKLCYADFVPQIDIATGHPVIFGLCQDITEKKQMENRLHQYQKVEAIGHLTGGLAHDFNNLLTVIIGNLDLELEGKSLSEKTRRRLGLSLDAAEKGAALTQKLLAFARRQPLKPTQVDINKIITDMKDLIARTLGQHIKLKTKLESQLFAVRTDQSQIENILLNLCINAHDAMPKGGHLIIETKNEHIDSFTAERFGDITTGDYINITVRDTGTGMDKGVLERAFEPFFTTKAAGQGTGLGLSTIYGFVKQSGGHITLNSSIGNGTTVTILLPALTEAAIDAQQQNATQTDFAGTGTILLVEDSSAVRDTVSSMLEDLGYKVVSVSDSTAALETLKQKDFKPDFMITDVLMPGHMDGQALATKARKLYPSIKILLSSGATKDTRLKDSDTIHAVIRKPYKKADLAQKLQELMDG